MEKLFGLPMNQLAYGLLGTLVVLVLVIAVFAVRNRFLIKLSLRNIPRRRAQSVLIVVGLMLSTTIVAASLSIGDTISASIRNAVLEGLGDTDMVVRKPFQGEFADPFLSADEIERLAVVLYEDERVDGLMLVSTDTLPVINQRSRLTNSLTTVRGYDLGGLYGDFRPESLGGSDGSSRLQPFTFGPDVNGNVVDMRALADAEVLINEILADELDAQPGDTLTIVTPEGRKDVRLVAIMARGGIAANDQRLLMPLSTYHRVVGSDVGTSSRLDISLDTERFELEESGDEIADDLRIRFTDEDLARQLHGGLRAAPAIVVGLESYLADDEDGAISDDDRETLQEFIGELKLEEPTERFRALASDDVILRHLFAALSEIDDEELQQNLPRLAFGLSQIEQLSPVTLKMNLLEIAEFVGNLFVTFFTFFGSFSVIVGLLLVFLIFVLLASERQQEMGIARAVGTKRGHLVQMFTFEGLAYAFGAALVGLLLGILTSRVMVGLMARLFGTDGDASFSIDFTVTLNSIIAAFSLGLVLTMLTVVFSAYRVSRLNIVVAIRNLPEEFVGSTTAPILHRLLNVVFWIFGPIYVIVRLIQAIRAHEDVGVTILNLVLTWLIVGWLFGLLGSVWRLIFPYFSQGWPLALAGAALAWWGLNGDTAWSTYIGASIAVYGVGLAAKVLMVSRGIRESIASRIAYTLVGVLILVMWATPSQYSEKVTGELDGNIEMFVLAGVWMVASAVWIVMYNSDLIVSGLQSTLGRSNVLRPILKPAVAYAVANRFRTGLTVSMFALVIFVMMSFSILNSSFSGVAANPEIVSGGFDVRASVSPDLPVDDVAGKIDESPDLQLNDFALITGMTDESASARQTDGEEVRYLDLTVRGAEPAYFSETQLRIQAVDPDYLPSDIDPEDDTALAEAVWDAIAGDESLAAITEEHVPGAGFAGGGPPGGSDGLFQLADVEINEEQEFDATDIEIVGAGSTDIDRAVTRTVIAIVDANADSLESAGDGGPAQGFVGIYTREDVFKELSDEPVPYTIYKMKLSPGADATEIAGRLETVFIDHRMIAVDTLDELDTAEAQNDQFSALFQGFMGLGLVVGVASLGVLSLRAVNERRMQIAIMRAVGYKGGMIRAQFMMESIFITLIGTGLGMGLGAIISWSFLDDISSANQELAFTVPWLSVSLIVIVTIVAALITTYVPARQASQVFPAEALRYE